MTVLTVSRNPNKIPNINNYKGLTDSHCYVQVNQPKQYWTQTKVIYFNKRSSKEKRRKITKLSSVIIWFGFCRCQMKLFMLRVRLPKDDNGSSISKQLTKTYRPDLNYTAKPCVCIYTKQECFQKVGV